MCRGMATPCPYTCILITYFGCKSSKCVEIKETRVEKSMAISPAVYKGEGNRGFRVERVYRSATSTLASSLRTLFTRWETGWAAIRAGSKGARRLTRREMGVAGSSHSSSAS